MLGNQKIRIAISGKANSGKNSLASILVSNMGLNETNSKMVGIADPMKNIIKGIFPSAKHECLFGPSSLRSEIINKKFSDVSGQPLTYRQALLDLGAYGRLYNNDIWLDLLVNDAEKSTDKLAYIITDCRFLNEFNYLKKAGFFCIRIIRNNLKLIDDISETEQDAIPDNQFDYIVKNNGSLKDLSLITFDIINKIREIK